MPYLRVLFMGFSKLKFLIPLILGGIIVYFYNDYMGMSKQRTQLAKELKQAQKEITHARFERDVMRDAEKRHRARVKKEITHADVREKRLARIEKQNDEQKLLLDSCRITTNSLHHKTARD